MRAAIVPIFIVLWIPGVRSNASQQCNSSLGYALQVTDDTENQILTVDCSQPQTSYCRSIPGLSITAQLETDIDRVGCFNSQSTTVDSDCKETRIVVFRGAFTPKWVDAQGQEKDASVTLDPSTTCPQGFSCGPRQGASTSMCNPCTPSSPCPAGTGHDQ